MGNKQGRKMQVSKYLNAAMKVVKNAGYGGGEEMYRKNAKVLDRLIEEAKKAGDEESENNIKFLYEALKTASTLYD